MDNKHTLQQKIHSTLEWHITHLKSFTNKKSRISDPSPQTLTEFFAFITLVIVAPNTWDFSRLYLSWGPYVFECLTIVNLLVLKFHFYLKLDDAG